MKGPRVQLSGEIEAALSSPRAIAARAIEMGNRLEGARYNLFVELSRPEPSPRACRTALNTVKIVCAYLWPEHCPDRKPLEENLEVLEERVRELENSG